MNDFVLLGYLLVLTLMIIVAIFIFGRLKISKENKDLKSKNNILLDQIKIMQIREQQFKEFLDGYTHDSFKNINYD